jgi:hypothetical protein
MKLDVDLDELDAINDPDVRNILKRIGMDGFAVFTNNKVNRKVSRATKDLRDKELIICSEDRRTRKRTLSVNNSILNADKIVSDCWEDIIKELK